MMGDVERQKGLEVQKDQKDWRYGGQKGLEWGYGNNNKDWDTETKKEWEGEDQKGLIWIGIWRDQQELGYETKKDWEDKDQREMNWGYGETKKDGDMETKRGGDTEETQRTEIWRDQQ